MTAAPGLFGLHACNTFIPVTACRGAADHRRRVIDEFDGVVSHLDGVWHALGLLGSAARWQPWRPPAHSTAVRHLLPNL